MLRNEATMKKMIIITNIHTHRERKGFLTIRRISNNCWEKPIASNSNGMISKKFLFIGVLSNTNVILKNNPSNSEGPNERVQFVEGRVMD